MVKKAEEVEKREVINIVETKKKNFPVGLIIFIVIVVSFAMILSAILPFIIAFGFLSFSEDNIDFKVIDENVISIPSKNTTIENYNEYYDEEDECYVIQFKVDHEEETGKKSTFFGVYEDSLDVLYVLRDKDGYVIGEEYLVIENFNSNDKVKKNIYYCEDNAKEVDSIEAREVTIY